MIRCSTYYKVKSAQLIIIMISISSSVQAGRYIRETVFYVMFLFNFIQQYSTCLNII